MKYRIKAKHNLGWRKEKIAIFGVSVGQDYHEGEKFKSTVGWLAKNFQEVHFLVADTLHRHNLMFEHGESAQQARVRSRLAGDAWLMRNSDLLRDIQVQWTMSRWDQWLHNEQFGLALKHVRSHFESTEELRASVLADANRFLLNPKRVELLDRHHDFATTKCIDLILEENAVFALVLDRYRGVSIYPGNELSSTATIRHLGLPGLGEGFYDRKFLKIEFMRRRGRDISNDDNVMDNEVPYLANE